MPEDIKKPQPRQLTEDEVANLISVRDALKAEKFEDVPEDLNEFFTLLNDPANLDVVHKSLINARYEDTPTSADDFRATLGIVSPNLQVRTPLNPPQEVPNPAGIQEPPLEPLTPEKKPSTTYGTPYQPQGMQFQAEAPPPELEKQIEGNRKLIEKLDQFNIFGLKELPLVRMAASMGSPSDFARFQADQAALDVARKAVEAFDEKYKPFLEERKAAMSSLPADESGNAQSLIGFAEQAYSKQIPEPKIPNELVPAFGRYNELKSKDNRAVGRMFGQEGLTPEENQEYKALQEQFKPFLEQRAATHYTNEALVSVQRTIEDKLQKESTASGLSSTRTLAQRAIGVPDNPVVNTLIDIYDIPRNMIWGLLDTGLKMVPEGIERQADALQPLMQKSQDMFGLAGALIPHNLVTAYASLDPRVRYKVKENFLVGFNNMTSGALQTAASYFFTSGHALQFGAKLLALENVLPASKKFVEAAFSPTQSVIGEVLPNDPVAQSFAEVVDNATLLMLATLGKGSKGPIGKLREEAKFRRIEEGMRAADFIRDNPTLKISDDAASLLNTSKENIDRINASLDKIVNGEAETVAEAAKLVAAEKGEWQPDARESVISRTRLPDGKEIAEMRRLGYTDAQIKSISEIPDYLDMVLNKQIPAETMYPKPIQEPAKAEAAPAETPLQQDFQAKASQIIDATKSSVSPEAELPTGKATAADLGRLIGIGVVGYGTARLIQAIAGSENDEKFNIVTAAIGAVGGFKGKKDGRRFIPASEVRSMLGSKIYSEMKNLGVLTETNSGVPARQAAIVEKIQNIWARNFKSPPESAKNLMEFVYNRVGESGVKLKHFSSESTRTGEVIVTTNPKMAGKGIAAGEETGRKRVPVTYFYRLESKPERRLRSYDEYRALADKVYDLDRDKLGIRSAVEGERIPEFAIEETLKSLGFNGYAAGNQIAMFIPTDVVRIRKNKMGLLIPAEYLDGGGFKKFADEMAKYGVDSEPFYKQAMNRIMGVLRSELKQNPHVEGVDITDNFGWWMADEGISLTPNVVFSVKINPSGMRTNFVREIADKIRYGLDQSSALTMRFPTATNWEPMVGEKPTQAIVIERKRGRFTKEELQRLTEIIKKSSGGRLSGGLVYDGKRIVMLRVPEYSPDYTPEKFVKDGVAVKDAMDSDMFLSERRQLGAEFDAFETSAYYTAQEGARKAEPTYENIIPETSAIQRPVATPTDKWSGVRGEIDRIFDETADQARWAAQNRAFDALPNEAKEALKDISADVLHTLSPDQIEFMGRMDAEQLAYMAKTMQGKGLTNQAHLVGSRLTIPEAYSRMQFAEQVATEIRRLTKLLERVPNSGAPTGPESESVQSIRDKILKLGMEQQRVREEMEGFLMKAADVLGLKANNTTALTVQQIRTLFQELDPMLQKVSHKFGEGPVSEGEKNLAGRINRALGLSEGDLKLIGAGLGSTILGRAVYEALTDDDKKMIDDLLHTKGARVTKAAMPWLFMFSPKFYSRNKFREHMTPEQKAQAYEPTWLKGFLYEKTPFKGSLSSLTFPDFLGLQWDYLVNRARELRAQEKTTTNEAELHEVQQRLDAIRGLVLEPKHIGTQVIEMARGSKNPITGWEDYRNRFKEAAEKSYDAFMPSTRAFITKGGEKKIIGGTEEAYGKMKDADWKRLFEEAKREHNKIRKQFFEERMPDIERIVEQAQLGLERGSYLWYDKLITELTPIFGEDTGRYVAAFTSINANMSNKNAAYLGIKALLKWEKDGNVDGVVGDSDMASDNRSNLQKMLEAAMRNDLFGAQKISAYHPSNLGFGDAMVSDVHDARSMGVKWAQPRFEIDPATGKPKVDPETGLPIESTEGKRFYTRNEYQHILALYQRVMEDPRVQKYTANQVQAAKWNPDNVKTLRQLLQEHVDEYGRNKADLTDVEKSHIVQYLLDHGMVRADNKIVMEEGAGKFSLSDAVPFALSLGLTGYELFHSDSDDDLIEEAGLMGLPALIGLKKMKSRSKMGNIAKNALKNIGDVAREMVGDGRMKPAEAGDFIRMGVEEWIAKHADAAKLTPEQRDSIRQLINDKKVMGDMIRGLGQTHMEHVIERHSDRILEENGIPVTDINRRVLELARLAEVGPDSKYITSYLKSALSWGAEIGGKAATEVMQRFLEGDIKANQLRTRGYELLNDMREVLAEHGVRGGIEAKDSIFKAVVNALEDRANADKHLKTPAQRDFYAATVKFFDHFREVLKEAGYDTIDNYYAHNQWADGFAKLVSDPASLDWDSQKLSKGELMQMINAKSKHLTPRTETTDKDIDFDIMAVARRYLSSVSRAVAYRDAVDYYYGQFRTDLPENKAATFSKTRNKSDFEEYMRNVLNPSFPKSTAMKVLMKLRSYQYYNFLWNNLKSAVENSTQLELARAKWLAESSKIERDLWKKYKTLDTEGDEVADSPIQGKLADAVRDASRDTPRYLDLYREEMGEQAWRAVEWLRSWDMFQWAERRNWRRAELGSIIDAVVKDKGWKSTLEKNGGNAEKAIDELLKNPDIYRKAVRNAAVISAETQVSPAPSMRARMYAHPMVRLMTTFTAFKFRQLQVFGQLIGSWKGSDGERAKSIIKRGVSEDARPVEALENVETVRKQVEAVAKEQKKYGNKLGVPEQAVTEVIQYLKKREASLNQIIKEIEPLAGNRGRAVGVMTRYLAEIYAVNFAFNMLWNYMDLGNARSEDFGEEGTKEYEEALFRKGFASGIMQLINVPYQNRSSVLPQDITKMMLETSSAISGEKGSSFRGPARTLLNYLTSVTPVLGVADRITGRRVQEGILDIIAPKKNEKKSGMFKAPSFKGGIGKSPLGK